MENKRVILKKKKLQIFCQIYFREEKMKFWNLKFDKVFNHSQKFFSCKIWINEPFKKVSTCKLWHYYRIFFTFEIPVQLECWTCNCQWHCCILWRSWCLIQEDKTFDNPLLENQEFVLDFLSCFEGEFSFLL